MAALWPSLLIRLGPSRRLTWMLIILHLGGAICVAGSDLPAGVIALIMVVLGVSLFRGLGAHGARRLAGAIVLLIWDERGRWHLLTRDGRAIEARLVPGGYAHPSLVALVLVTRSRRKLPVVIVGDAVESETLRSLCVRLRCSS